MGNPGDRALKTERNIYLTFTGIIQVILGASLVYFFLIRDFFNVFLTALVFMLNLFPVFLSRRYKIFVPPEFQLLVIVFIFATIFLGSVFDLYYKFNWWDTVLHMLSGFLLGLIGFVVLFVLNRLNHIPREMKPFFICFFAVTFAVFLGVIWEIYEFIQDQIWPQFNMQTIETGVTDTMIDLIVDLIGATVVAFMGYFYLKSGKYSFLADGVRSFILQNPDFFKSKPAASSH